MRPCAWTLTYDVLIFPTRFEGEGFPGVVLDAFIAGLPVITTDFHVNPEVIKNMHNGLIIPTSDYQALIESLLTLYQHPEILTKMKQFAYDSALLYTPERLLPSVFKYS